MADKVQKASQRLCSTIGILTSATSAVLFLFLVLVEGNLHSTIEKQGLGVILSNVMNNIQLSYTLGNLFGYIILIGMALATMAWILTVFREADTNTVWIMHYIHRLLFSLFIAGGIVVFNVVTVVFPSMSGGLIETDPLLISIWIITGISLIYYNVIGFALLNLHIIHKALIGENTDFLKRGTVNTIWQKVKSSLR